MAICTAKAGNAAYATSSSLLFQNRSSVAHRSARTMRTVSVTNRSRLLTDTYWLNIRNISALSKPQLSGQAHSFGMIFHSFTARRTNEHRNFPSMPYSVWQTPNGAPEERSFAQIEKLSRTGLKERIPKRALGVALRYGEDRPGSRPRVPDHGGALPVFLPPAFGFDPRV